MLDKETIKEIALAKGFKLKPQENGEMDLNPYVYEFANAIAEHCWSAFKSGVMPHKIHPTKASLNNGWISINDMLPESNGDFYLVYTETGRTCECRYYCDEWITTYCNNEKVTHWQPLPQLPKE